MGDFDGAFTAIMLVVGIVAFCIYIWAIWMVAGFICVTLGWSAMSEWAQFCVAVLIVFLLSGRTK